MCYTLYFPKEAKKDLSGLKINEPAAFKIAKFILTESQKHPRTPEPFALWLVPEGKLYNVPGIGIGGKW